MKWFEEYEGCDCSSDIVFNKKELLGYCALHGGNRRHAFSVRPGMDAAAEDRANEVDPRPCSELLHEKIRVLLSD